MGIFFCEAATCGCALCRGGGEDRLPGSTACRCRGYCGLLFEEHRICGNPLSHRSFLTLPRVRRVGPKTISMLPADSSGSSSIQRLTNGQRQADRRCKSCEMQNKGPGSAREWRVEFAVGTVASLCQRRKHNQKV